MNHQVWIDGFKSFKSLRNGNFETGDGSSNCFTKISQGLPRGRSRSQDAVLREPSAQSTEASAALSSKAAGPSRRPVVFLRSKMMIGW
jgi:hypothetical protein